LKQGFSVKLIEMPRKTVRMTVDSISQLLTKHEIDDPSWKAVLRIAEEYEISDEFEEFEVNENDDEDSSQSSGKKIDIRFLLFIV
jgi:hypothetical protein